MITKEAFLEKWQATGGKMRGRPPKEAEQWLKEAGLVGKSGQRVAVQREDGTVVEVSEESREVMKDRMIESFIRAHCRGDLWNKSGTERRLG